jgi:hypothetical protein
MKRLSVDLNDEDYKRLKQEVLDQDTTISEYIRQLLSQEGICLLEQKI